MMKKIEKKILRYIKKILRYIIKHRTGKRLENREKKKCMLHADWRPLAREELKKINRKEKYGYMIYKNVQYFSPDFVTDAYYRTEILPVLNKYDYSIFGRRICTDFSDKNYFEILMPELNFPKAVLRQINGILYDSAYNIVSMENVIQKLRQYDSLVLKNSIDTGHGKGVKKVSSEELISILTSGGYKKDFIVQELIQQHETLAYYNDSSVNTVRVTTLFWSGEVFILEATLRIGAPGSFCDHLSNGGVSPLVIPLEKNGVLRKEAYTRDFYRLENVFGKEIIGEVPCYKEMADLAVETHKRFAHHGIIGWDFTVDKDKNIVCIEYNTFCPGIVFHQCALGPIFNIQNQQGEFFLDAVKNHKL